MTNALYQKVDLHTHSTASDGKLTPAQLVDLAAEEKVTTLALTDHDSISGLPAAHQQAAQHDITLINGCEFSVAWQKTPLHMVALNFSLDDPAIARWTEHNQQVRLQRGRQIANLLIKNGLPDLFDDAVEQANGSQLGRPHFAQVMIRRGIVKDANRAFDHYLGNKKLGQIRDVWPQLEEILPALSQNKMELVLAHPKRYPITVTKLKSILADFKKWGGTGMEVVSGNERPDHVHFMERLSRDFALKASVGSDYHGPFGPWTQVGRYTQIHEQEVSPIWYPWGN